MAEFLFEKVFGSISDAIKEVRAISDPFSVFLEPIDWCSSFEELEDMVCFSDWAVMPWEGWLWNVGFPEVDSESGVFTCRFVGLSTCYSVTMEDADADGLLVSCRIPDYDYASIASFLDAGWGASNYDAYLQSIAAAASDYDEVEDKPLWAPNHCRS